MDRIVHSSAVDIGGGRRGFRSKDTVGGVPGTVVTAGHMNATQEEMVAIIEKAGLAPDASDLTQLVKAIRSQRLNYVQAAQVAGTANAVTLAFTPEFGALSELIGVPIVHIAEATNTDAMTVKVDSLAPVARTWADGTALVGGDVQSGRLVVERFDGTAFRMEGSRRLARLAERQPIYPEVTSANAVLTFSTAAGQVVVAAGSWQHRGLATYDATMFSAGERTFATAANKTYHLRWHAPGTGTATPLGSYPLGRFELVDLTGASPVETDAVYDSTFDRMLGARVVTNGANAPTVTALANRARLAATASKTDITRHATWAGIPRLAATLNWARTPAAAITAMSCDATTDFEALNWCDLSATRYAVDGAVGGYMINYASWSPNHFVSGSMAVALSA